MANYVTVDGLTDLERKFVENFAFGMTQSQAARVAGYANPFERAKELLRKPHIIAAIDVLRTQNAERIDVSRKDVLEGMKEAIDMARSLQDPVAMIAGWREIAKVCGHYEPTRKQVDISINGHVALQKLEQLPDADLMKLIEAEVIEVEDDESD